MRDSIIKKKFLLRKKSNAYFMVISYMYKMLCISLYTLLLKIRNIYKCHGLYQMLRKREVNTIRSRQH